MSDERDNDEGLPSSRREPTAVKRRLEENGGEILGSDPSELLFQHTVLCQTYLPHRDPKAVRRWERSNGNVSLLVTAGEVIDPRTRKFREVGLPYGPKARLVFAHLNSRAMKFGSNVIPLEEGSFTAFVGSMQRSAPNGRELRAYKEQLTRLSVAKFTLAACLSETEAIQISPQMIEKMRVTFYSDERQRHLWPDTITLSPAYWESLQKHAVPLDARALAALAHSALALDVYQWLAQRLHRIKDGKKQDVPRTALYQQFGQSYADEPRFWHKFKGALHDVHAVYRRARLDVTPEGLTLYPSLPPIPKCHLVPSWPPSWAKAAE